MKNFKFAVIVGALTFLLAGCCHKETAVKTDSDNIAAYFENIKPYPAKVRAFLRAMPKGGDLHNHLVGAIYAENYISWAIDNKQCIVSATKTIVDPPCSKQDGKPLVKDFVNSDSNYNDLIDALSVRNYAQNTPPGNEQFFNTFQRFDTVAQKEKVAMQIAVMESGANQNILYLELMSSTGMEEARELGRKVGYNPNFNIMIEKLKQAGIEKIVKKVQSKFLKINKDIRSLLNCDGINKKAACDVEVRYLSQIIRTFSKEEVFAQTMLAFLLAEYDPLIVGINLVGPEDNRVAFDDYSLHMQIIGRFGQIYKKAGIALHAGELTIGLVPPKYLRSHINEAVAIAQANRIGHGVDIMFEDEPISLLKKMAEKRIPVEINLTSNDIILGVVGSNHPFEIYRKFNVPIVLSTDDEGVSRINLTNEYTRAVLTYDLPYEYIKELSFNSLKYSFLDRLTKNKLLAKLTTEFLDFEKNYDKSVF